VCVCVCVCSRADFPCSNCSHRYAAEKESAHVHAHTRTRTYEGTHITHMRGDTQTKSRMCKEALQRARAPGQHARTHKAHAHRDARRRRYAPRPLWLRSRRTEGRPKPDSFTSMRIVRGQSPERMPLPEMPREICSAAAASPYAHNHHRRTFMTPFLQASRACPERAGAGSTSAGSWSACM
jgi:hypothetical protein